MLTTCTCSVLLKSSRLAIINIIDLAGANSEALVIHVGNQNKI